MEIFLLIEFYYHRLAFRVVIPKKESWSPSFLSITSKTSNPFNLKTSFTMPLTHVVHVDTVKVNIAPTLKNLCQIQIPF